MSQRAQEREPACQDKFSQWFKPLFSCHRSPCFTLWLERSVDILHLHKGLCIFDSRHYLVCHFLLLSDRRDYLAFTFFEISQVSEPVSDLSKHLIVQRACQLFSVSSNKRYSFIVIKECNSVVYLLLSELKFFRKGLVNVHVFTNPFYYFLRIITYNIIAHFR